jgi:hypothetical protein
VDFWDLPLGQIVQLMLIAFAVFNCHARVVDALAPVMVVVVLLLLLLPSVLYATALL